MKNLKKVLACLLVAAMTLTCFVGALTVSADGTGTIVAADVEVASDATSVVVPVTITADAALNAAKITVAAEGYSVDAIAVDAASVDAYIDAEDVNGGTFLIQAKDNTTGFTTAVVNVTFAAEAVAAADVVITLDEVHAATWDEAVVNLAIDNGSIAVKAAVVEAKLDESLTLFNVSASVQDSLGIGYIIMNKTYNTKYARIEMEVVANKYNNDRDLDVETKIVPFTPLNGTSTTISNAVYSGIAMFEIDQTVTAKIKAYDAEGNYVAYSKDYVNDPVSLLKTLYSTSTNDLYKTMVTDMFNLGTAAQAYFGTVAAQTNPDNDLLANYNENPINKGWDQTYASQGMPELTLANTTTWDANSPLKKADLTFMANLNLAATPSVGYLFKLNNANYTLDDIRIEVSYDAVYPKSFAGTRTETFTAANFGTAATFKTAIFTKMTLTDSNREVTAKVYCKDQLVLTSVYTMDQGIKTQAATAGAKDLATALGQFETAARNYFASV